ncbi:hypothetical protein V8G54_016111 [Vigna mungo]|uniref:LysM domain-containing protein n=1 Tax=Vigna mungo TaxID=3915 RepID=A0AAQ3S0T4_VIGMU
MLGYCGGDPSQLQWLLKMPVSGLGGCPAHDITNEIANEIPVHLQRLQYVAFASLLGKLSHLFFHCNMLELLFDLDILTECTGKKASVSSIPQISLLITFSVDFFLAWEKISDNSSDPLVLDVGHNLVVPLPCTCFNRRHNYLPSIYLSYVVNPMDTLAAIAARYFTTLTDLMNVNDMGSAAISDRDILVLSQKLVSTIDELHRKFAPSEPFIDLVSHVPLSPMLHLGFCISAAVALSMDMCIITIPLEFQFGYAAFNLKAAYRDLSSSAIKSALMTTAYTHDNTESPLGDATGEEALSTTWAGL